MLASTKLFTVAYLATIAAIGKVKACGNAKVESLLNEACVRLLSSELAKFAPVPNSELNESEKQFARNGMRATAIRDYRIRNLSSGCTLLTAKEVVDKWMTDNSLPLY